MTAFDTAWGLVKADTGMWEEIYAPLLAQTTGMGDLDSARFASDFVPTKIAMDNIRARVDEDERDEFMDKLHQNRGDHGFDVDRLVQSILEEGFNPLLPPAMIQGKMRKQGWNRSGRPDPSFEFGRNRMEQYEGNHRLLALAKLGAPYVPYMGFMHRIVDEYPENTNPHPFSFGSEFQHVIDNAQGYSLGGKMRRGRIPIPPSYIYGRELVPEMGRLLPMNPVTGEPVNLLTEYDEQEDWIEKPSWRRVFD